MPEFKFSCPQCGQRIQCDTAYVGAQINCPACQQAITVPQASGAAAPPPVLPPVTPAGRATAAPVAAPRQPTAPLPVKKSHTLRNVLVITACVVFVVLAGLGVLGWMGYSKFKAQQLAASKGNPAAMVAAPSAVQQTAALDIFHKMQNAYTNLDTLQASATSVMDLDMSQLSADDLNPNAKKAKTAKTKKTHRPAGMPKSITTTMQVSIKLQRPGSYLVKATSHMSLGFMTMTNVNVTWSSGETNYCFMNMNNGTFKTYTTVKDRDTGVMSGGQPCILALGMMEFFFSADPGKATKIIHDLGQTDDEPINGQDCYTLTAKVFGQKLKFWVSKSNYMILQSQFTLGAPVSDEDIDEAFDAFDTDTKQTPAQIAQQKAQAKQQATMMTKIRGTITDTCDDVQANPSLAPDDFQYKVPRGTKLVRG